MLKFLIFTIFIVDLLVAAAAFAEPVFILDNYGQRIQLHERSLPSQYNECDLCHTKKALPFIRGKKTLLLNHTEKSLQHGRSEISCNNCHDVNRTNYLRSGINTKASFENSSPVCERCHADKYRSWVGGTHGKRQGKWNGDKIQFQCIDCHDPHSVSFKKMEAKPAPYLPKYVIIKQHDEHEQNEKKE